MGILPLAPRSNRLEFPGERNPSGFMENPVDAGFMINDRMNMAPLRYMMDLMS